jgi:hypothetical protein
VLMQCSRPTSAELLLDWGRCRNYHRSSQARLVRKLKYKEDWLMDLFIACGFVQITRKDLIGFIEQMGIYTVSRWRLNKIKHRQLGMLFVRMYREGIFSKDLIRNVHLFVDLVALLLRAKVAIRELGTWFGPDWIDREDLVLTDQGKEKLFLLQNSKSKRFKRKAMDSFKIFRSLFNLPALVDNRGLASHVLVTVISDRAEQLRKAVLGLLEDPICAWEDKLDDFMRLMSVLTAALPPEQNLREQFQGKVIRPNLQRKIYILLRLMYTQDRFTFARGLSRKVRIVAEVGLNGFNVWTPSVIDRTMPDGSTKYFFVKPSVLQNPEVIDLIMDKLNKRRDEDL